MGGEDASMGTVEGVDRHHLSVPGVIVSGGGNKGACWAASSPSTAIAANQLSC